NRLVELRLILDPDERPAAEEGRVERHERVLVELGVPRQVLLNILAALSVRRRQQFLDLNPPIAQLTQRAQGRREDTIDENKLRRRRVAEAVLFDQPAGGGLVRTLDRRRVAGAGDGAMLRVPPRLG